VGQAAGMAPWDDFDSQDGDVTQAGTHASPVSLRTGPVVPRPWRYPVPPKLTKKEIRKKKASRVVAGTEQPDTLPWRDNAAVTPPGDWMAAENTCYTAHACPFMITSETSHHTLTHIGHTPTHSGTLTQHATHTHTRARERERERERERQRERERERAREREAERKRARETACT
jgi:hypothetical protein